MSQRSRAKPSGGDAAEQCGITLWRLAERLLGPEPLAYRLRPHTPPKPGSGSERGSYAPSKQLETFTLQGDSQVDGQALAAKLDGAQRVLLDLLGARLTSGDHGAALIKEILASLNPGARLGLLLHAASLASSQWQPLRAFLVEHTQLDWMVWLEAPGSTLADLHRPPSVVLVTLRTRTEAGKQPVRLVDLHQSRSNDPLDLIDECERRSGGEMGAGIVRREPLNPNHPWTWSRLSRTYEERLRDTSELGELVPLEDLAERIFLGVVAMGHVLVRLPEDGAIPDGVVPMLNGGAIGEHGINLPLSHGLVEARARPALVEAGDWVMPAAARSGAPLRVEVFDGSFRAVAGGNLLVVRLREQVPPLERTLLLAYLRSTHFAATLAASQGGDRITAEQLREAKVPRFGGHVLDAMRRLTEAEERFEQLARQTRVDRLAFMEAKRFRDAVPRLLSQSRATAERVEAADEAVTLAGRIRRGFPHALVLRRESILQMAPGPQQLDSILECAEYLVTYLAFLGQLNLAGQIAGALRSDASRAGRLSIDWGKSLEVLRQCAAESARAPDPTALPVPELGSLHEDLLAIDSRWATACDELMSWRNKDAHLHRWPDVRIVEAAGRFVQALDVMFDRAQFITDTPLVEVLDYVWDEGQDERHATFSKLVGQSPVFASIHETVHQELARGATGIRDLRGHFHSLGPWLVRRSCPECHHRETFIFNRLDAGGAGYVSMEMGHPLLDVPAAQRLQRSLGLTEGRPRKGCS